MQLVNTLQTLYNVSLPLALSLTTFGFLISGRNGHPTIPFIGTIDLHDFARHGRIEHDGSLAHADAAPHAVFAPTVPDKALLEDLLANADGEYLTMEDMVRVRSKKDMQLARDGRTLDGTHGMSALPEISL
jgi:Peroxidase, family 2